MSELQIKVSRISSLTDARYCAGMGVKYLSLVFDEAGETSLSPSAFQAIRAWIEGVEWMGEFQGTDPTLLKELARNYELTTWVVPKGFPELIADSEEAVLRLIYSVSGPEARHADSENLEVEISRAGTDGSLDQLEKLNQKSGLRILRNPSSASEILEIHRKFPDLIFNLDSGEEERPGWMDLSHLQDILEELEGKGLSL